MTEAELPASENKRQELRLNSKRSNSRYHSTQKRDSHQSQPEDMENPSVDQKPRAVSDITANHVNQDPRHIQKRSLTDIQTVHSRRFNLFIKNGASKNTTPPLISEKLQRALPPAPLTENKCNAIYETVTEPEMQTSTEHMYKEIGSKNMNIDCGQWKKTSAAEWLPNQEVTGEERKQETEEEKEVPQGDFNGLSNSHKRSESSWSFSSFIGPPVDLVAEVLSGEEWARYLENNPKLPPDPPPLIDFYESNLYIHDPVHSKSTKKQNTSMEKNMDLMKITEVSKVLMEEPKGPQRLPPKLFLASSSSAQSSVFKSSIFYNLPPPGQELPVNTPKSGPSALKRIRAKLRKSSAEEAQLKETLE